MHNMTDYHAINDQVAALIRNETSIIANFANIAAVLNAHLNAINWVGFYFVHQQTLILGPFIGNPACVRIAYNKGVCGTAWATGEIQRIANVHEFAGHIACDAASQSEIVLPIKSPQGIIGVLDIDSPNLDRFSSADEAGLAMIVTTIEQELENMQQYEIIC